jgi:hypothetical protein
MSDKSNRNSGCTLRTSLNDSGNMCMEESIDVRISL